MRKILLVVLLFGALPCHAATGQWTWTQINGLPISPAQTLTDIEIINGHYLLAGDDGILDSTDGASWAQVYPAPTEQIAYGNGVYVGLSFTAEVVTSGDAANWTAQPKIVTSCAAEEIVFGSGRFILTCENSAYSATSPDGVHWTPRSHTGEPRFDGLLAYDGKQFVALDNSPVNISFSTDGVNWTTRQTKLSAQLQPDKLRVLNGHYILLGGNVDAMGAEHPYVAYSTDGVDWTQTTLAQYFGVADDITYVHGQYVLGMHDPDTYASFRILGSQDLRGWKEFPNTPPTMAPIVYATDGTIVLGAGFFGTLVEGRDDSGKNGGSYGWLLACVLLGFVALRRFG